MLKHTMVALAGAAAIGVGFAGSAEAATISFTSQGTFQASVFSQDGLTLTGSNTLDFINLNGVGVVGGFADSLVDSDESLLFEFDAVWTSVSLNVGLVGNPGGITAAPVIAEGFGQDGTSLGEVFVGGGLQTFLDISEAFGNQGLTGFRITNPNDGYRYTSLNFEVAPPPVESVPEPASLLGLAAIGAVAAGGALKKKVAA